MRRCGTPASTNPLGMRSKQMLVTDTSAIFIYFIQILRKSGIWVAKIAEQVLVQRLPKAKTKKPKQNNKKHV